jgi:drug/metabolite transporter (DMT)-like permease
MTAPVHNKVWLRATIALVVLYVVGGSLIGIAQRFLTFHFDSFTQNGFRMLPGALTLLAIAALFRRDDLMKTLRSPGSMRSLLLLSAASIVPGFLVVEGIRYTSAVMAGLIGTIGVPLTITLAVIVFPDERQSARGKRFLIGSALALGGTLGLALVNGVTVEYSRGLLFLLAATAIGAASSLLTKRLLLTGDPFSISGISGLFTAVFFVIASFISGGAEALITTPIINTVVLIGSGIYGLLIGSGIYMVIIRRIGLIPTRFADLTMPVFTGLLGYLFFGELLTPAQLLFGVCLIAGCVLILSKRGSATVQVGTAES